MGVGNAFVAPSLGNHHSDLLLIYDLIDFHILLTLLYCCVASAQVLDSWPETFYFGRSSEASVGARSEFGVGLEAAWWLLGVDPEVE